MIKFLKLIARGKKAVVPKPMFAREENNEGTNPIRSHSKSVSSPFTNVIPNRSVTMVKNKYVAPPKRQPFAVIPEGVCRGCD